MIAISLALSACSSFLGQTVKEYRLVQDGENKHDNVFFRPGFCTLEEGLDAIEKYDWVALEVREVSSWRSYDYPDDILTIDRRVK